VRRADSSNKDEEQETVLRLSRHLLKPNGSILGREVAELHAGSSHLASAIPQSARLALGGIDGREPITRPRRGCRRSLDPAFMLGFGRNDRSLLVLPNGPELALAIVATAVGVVRSLVCQRAHSELEADLLRMRTS
jgi:hypothetical protein